MSSEGNRNDLNKEFIYVRRLISVLTNDDSDKLIVEKLKGKNLSSLLYNAKIIDNSKNMTANKKILACVIRAIEREKHLSHRRDLEQSWGRKFLNSFNCLYPGLKPNKDCSQQSIFSRGCGHERKSNSRSIKHRTLSRKTKTSTHNSSTCKNSIKRFGCDSSMKCNKRVEMKNVRNKAKSYASSCKDKVEIYVGSFATECPENYLVSGSWQPSQLIPMQYKVQNKLFETIRPPLLRQRKLNCVRVYPGRPLPSIKRIEKADKKSSSTQTVDSSVESLSSMQVPNNIKLQDLLEAASNLINTQDQREYVRAFLSNFEPPFDLSAGFPPYLKLPMKKSDDMLGKESVYGTNSEFSLRSERSPVRQTHKDVKQQEDNVKKYVRDLMDPWQDTAESIISGVINESLPHERADYSQLGACILKRLGAYPGSNSHRVKRNHHSIPEIVLQCTEFFESDAGDTIRKQEHPEPSKLEKVPSSSIIEMKILDGEIDDPKPWEGQITQNYCFFEADSACKVDLLNMSESSLVDVGNFEDKPQGQGDGVQDRKNLQLREPLKITPSGLEQGGRKSKKAGIQKHEANGMKVAGGKRGTPLIPELKVKGLNHTGKSQRQKVSIYTVSTKNNEESIEPTDGIPDQLATIESVSLLQPECSTMSPKIDTRNSTAETPTIVEIMETETPPPEPAPAHWEATVSTIETFDGVGEGQKKLTESSASKSDKKQPANKNRSFQDKLRGKKKCKTLSKKHPDKNEDDLSRNCKVM